MGEGGTGVGSSPQAVAMIKQHNRATITTTICVVRFI
jgi:hypothetical protein